jgi:hypothetical protein
MFENATIEASTTVRIIKRVIAQSLVNAEVQEFIRLGRIARSAASLGVQHVCPLDFT